MDATKPYEFIGFGAMDVTKTYEFIWFGAMDVRHSESFGSWSKHPDTGPTVLERGLSRSSNNSIAQSILLGF